MSEPPPELDLALKCQRWNTLPHAGGILDQPEGLMDKLGWVLNVYNIVRAYIDAPIKDRYIENYPDAYWKYKDIKKMVEEDNARSKYTD